MENLRDLFCQFVYVEVEVGINLQGEVPAQISAVCGAP